MGDEWVRVSDAARILEAYRRAVKESRQEDKGWAPLTDFERGWLRGAWASEYALYDGFRHALAAEAFAAAMIAAANS